MNPRSLLGAAAAAALTVGAVAAPRAQSEGTNTAIQAQGGAGMNKLSSLIGAAFRGGAPATLHGNAIHVIAPYRHHGMWVFDDARVGLHQEPFVSGADDWISRVVADIPDAERGFTMVFSAKPFPGHQYRMERRRLDMGGAWYWSPQLGMEGWLCSALFRYFAEAPEELYVQVKPKA